MSAWRIACRQRSESASDHVDVGLESGSGADSSTRSNQRLRDLVCLAESSVSHLTSSQLSHCALLQSCRLRSHASHLAERHACQSLPQRSPSLRFLCCPVCPTVALHALQASGSPHLLYCHSSRSCPSSLSLSSHHVTLALLSSPASHVLLHLHSSRPDRRALCPASASPRLFPCSVPTRGKVAAAASLRRHAAAGYRMVVPTSQASLRHPPLRCRPRHRHGRLLCPV